MPIKIVPLQKEDIPGVVECIQQGFADDPYFQWVFDASKPASQPETWYAWYQEWLLSARQLLTNLRYWGRGGLITKRYWIWKAQQAEAQREIWTDKERGYYFCNIVTVRPDAQGRGIGRRLFEVVTDRADREGVKCYLESSKSEPNVRIYEKLGFRMVKTMDCDDAGDVCRLYCMVREPRTDKL